MSSCVVPVECGTPDGKTDGKIDGKIDYHGRRRFNSPLDPITAQLYRPFILDGRAPYKRRFEWTGERLADDVDSSGGGAVAAAAAAARAKTSTGRSWEREQSQSPSVLARATTATSP